MAHELTLLYDGECPLCLREIGFLKRRDRRDGRIRFEDISDPSTDLAKHGLDIDTAMARMHAVLADGSVIEGVEVFRRAYSAIGLGWLLAPTGWWGFRRLADYLYGVFARNRFRFRSTPCEGDRCQVRETGSNETSQETVVRR
jgi:predicted DCC family thiol-disulfide oxidoreductase YuxK